MAERDRAPGAIRGRKPNGSHLFIGGLLRCSCGYALVPRTYRNRRAVYICRGRIDNGAEFCEQQPIPRQLIDSSVLAHFEAIGLDVTATRKAFAQAIELRLRETRALREHAETAAHKATEALERLERDYRAGDLSGASYERLRPDWTTQAEAAAAEVERLRDREREITNVEPLRDVEEEVLRWLAELRQVIAGEVRAAGSIEAVRSALRRLFDGFILAPTWIDCLNLEPGSSEEVLLLPDSEYVLIPKVKKQAVEGYEAGDVGVPILKRTPIQPPRQVTETV